MQEQTEVDISILPPPANGDQSTIQSKIIFVNPFTHHSYFTILALSACGPVEVLCPPLILQLWLGHWRREALSLRRSFLGVFFAQPLALVAYGLFSLRCISENFYLHCFYLAARIVLLQPGAQLVYVFQDYMLPLMARTHPQRRFISEFIIQISPDLANYRSSVCAAQLAQRVVAPTSLIQAELKDHGVEVVLAPYGGDKSRYRRLHHKVFITPKPDELTPSVPVASNRFLIAARANTFRKGLDLLLEALKQLDHHWPADLQTKVEVVICGPVVEMQRLLAVSDRISISSGQLSQDAYLELLHQADLFVMPSRLEGSSPAALEALWLGVPALLTANCGVESFQPGEHGLLIDPPTAPVLSDHLRQVLLHPELLSTWRHTLARDRHRFTWNRYLATVAQLLASP